MKGLMNLKLLIMIFLILYLSVGVLIITENVKLDLDDIKVPNTKGSKT
jgi:hypothetical protein